MKRCFGIFLLFIGTIPGFTEELSKDELLGSWDIYFVNTDEGDKPQAYAGVAHFFDDGIMILVPEKNKATSRSFRFAVYSGDEEIWVLEYLEDNLAWIWHYRYRHPDMLVMAARYPDREPQYEDDIMTVLMRKEK